MASRANKLASKGWLSLIDFTKYLKEEHPNNTVSYPTAINMVKEGKLRVIVVGNTYRVYQTEISRYLREGNFDPQKLQGLPKDVVQETRSEFHRTQIRPRINLVGIAELPDDDDEVK